MVGVESSNDFFVDPYKELLEASAFYKGLVGRLCYRFVGRLIGKGKKKALCSTESFLHLRYPERDLNPHVRNGHRILSPGCLPIPPSGRCKRTLAVLRH